MDNTISASHYKAIKPWQERLLRERAELQIKRDKLLTFVANGGFQDIEAKDAELISEQLQAMNHYLHVLEVRSQRFTNINPEKETQDNG